MAGTENFQACGTAKEHWNNRTRKIAAAAALFLPMRKSLLTSITKLVLVIALAY
jgi:hypothetical protein